MGIETSPEQMVIKVVCNHLGNRGMGCIYSGLKVCSLCREAPTPGHDPDGEGRGGLGALMLSVCECRGELGEVMSLRSVSKKLFSTGTVQKAVSISK